MERSHVRINAVITLVLISIILAVPTHAADGLIANLISERLALMKYVAAFKYLGDIPVEDKDREAVVLASAVDQARDEGLGGETMVPFFTAQIDAAKAIQDCWIERWRTDAAPPPVDAPDLADTIRPRLIEIGDALIAAIADNMTANGMNYAEDPPAIDCLAPAKARAIVDGLVAITSGTSP